MLDRETIPKFLFFFNDTATTEIYTLSLHDALPICRRRVGRLRVLRGQLRQLQQDVRRAGRCRGLPDLVLADQPDRKSTRLNSSHANISYAAFCLSKKLQKSSSTQAKA